MLPQRSRCGRHGLPIEDVRVALLALNDLHSLGQVADRLIIIAKNFGRSHFGTIAPSCDRMLMSGALCAS